MIRAEIHAKRDHATLTVPVRAARPLTELFCGRVLWEAGLRGNSAFFDSKDFGDACAASAPLYGTADIPLSQQVRPRI